MVPKNIGTVARPDAHQSIKSMWQVGFIHHTTKGWETIPLSFFSGV